jgi:hypothetical protein
METISNPNLTFKVLLHREEEGAYTVTVPALPGGRKTYMFEYNLGIEIPNYNPRIK